MASDCRLTIALIALDSMCCHALPRQARAGLPQFVATDQTTLNILPDFTAHFYIQ